MLRSGVFLAQELPLTDVAQVENTPSHRVLPVAKTDQFDK
jgi:hypothetical protein